jgi:hypothetical protein
MNDIASQIKRQNDCGTANDHYPAWAVSLTAPNGRTGIELVQCTACLMRLLDSPAVQRMGRIAHVRAYHK